jgi:hypothetical protein
MTENQTQAAPDAIRAALGQAIIACKDSHAWDAPAGCPSTDCHLRCPFSPALARLAALEAVAEAARDCRDTLAVLPDCAALLDSLADLDT